MIRRTIVPVFIVLSVVACTAISLLGVWSAIKEARATLADEPPSITTAENAAEVDELPTETEIPVEEHTKPLPVEIVPLQTCVVEEPAPEPAPTVRYELTDAERALVESVVEAESCGEPYEGQMAVAQCILNGCEELNMRPDAVVIEWQYTPNRPMPSQSVKDAVSAVFDRGEVAVDDDIFWFYAPAKVTGTPWHETQRHVCTIGGHKFFGEWQDG